MINAAVNLAPKSVIGNPESIYAPAQAITLQQLGADLMGSLLTPILPDFVDFNNLPPQTLIGNGTDASAALGFITFSQFNTILSLADLPTATYTNFDPDNVPPYTLVGNLSTTAARFAVPVSIGNLSAFLSSEVAAFLPVYFQNVFFFLR